MRFLKQLICCVIYYCSAVDLVSNLSLPEKFWVYLIQINISNFWFCYIVKVTNIWVALNTHSETSSVKSDKIDLNINLSLQEIFQRIATRSIFLCSVSISLTNSWLGSSTYLPASSIIVEQLILLLIFHSYNCFQRIITQ